MGIEANKNDLTELTDFFIDKLKSSEYHYKTFVITRCKLEKFCYLF
ncbi:MAG TPA: hypothetical protein PKL04_11100 [Methanofastidiosum sp.]|nr:hypothetical protein [Methanofastidiosum sp.]